MDLALSSSRPLLCAAFALLSFVGGLPPGHAQQSVEGTGGVELVLSAIGLIGVPYRYGGTDPTSGLDCSGLVNFVARSALGMTLPRQSEAMVEVGLAVERQALEPGDLVFFNTLGRPFSHVGVYLGDDLFVHAPTRGGRVRIESMTRPYWAKRYNGARRLRTLAVGAREISSPTVAPSDKARTEEDDPLGLSRP